jgi:septal ring factor EnvC (AmiA/AmiB activator)
MSEDPDKAASEARGAELRENIALTDARRTEEERAKAEQAAEDATKEAEKLSRKEQREREKAARLHEAADRERAQAPPVIEERPEHTSPAAAVAGMPGVDKLPAAAQRPEVLVGAAFAGSFLVARILKRIFD